MKRCIRRARHNLVPLFQTITLGPRLEVAAAYSPNIALL
jgi:hypothetical protein